MTERNTLAVVRLDIPLRGPGAELVVSVEMIGGETTLDREGLHARGAVYRVQLHDGRCASITLEELGGSLNSVLINAGMAMFFSTVGAGVGRPLRPPA